jgi:peptidoglycan lytic transglycosylase G
MLERALAAGFLVFTAAVAAGAGWFVYNTPDTVSDGDAPRAVATLEAGGEPVLITVQSGASAKDIGGELAARGVIRSGRLFEVLVGLTGVQNSLEAGDYEFDRGVPAIEAVHRIAQGRTASRGVVFPEGTRAEEMGEILEQRGIVTKQQFLDAVAAGGYNEPFLSQIATGRLDGFLFPAGYEFNRDTDAGQVVATMLRAFQDSVADSLQLEGQGLSLFDVVTLASIVEREAVVTEERPLIAAVFLNRLRIGLPLQADPTVQYALTLAPGSVEQFGYWKKDLTLDDLQYDSPYNTYVYAGLPPGPITNPGLDSMQAVVRPANTEFLFFVAKGDGSGEHVFAETLEEHLENVAREQQ